MAENGCELMRSGNRWRQIHCDPNVYMVQVPFTNVSTSETNVFVVEDAGEALLVDTGAPTDAGAAVLRRALEEIGVDSAEMSFFLTHLHMDHAGLVDRIVPSEAPLYVNKVDFDLMIGSKEPHFWERAERRVRAEGVPAERARRYCRAGRYGTGIDSFKAEGRDIRFSEEGDGIAVGRHTLRVVSTAGHTPGHQSLFHEESGLFFGGDHVLFVISPGLGFRPDTADPMAVYLDNVRKMLDMDISRLLVSHGDLRDGWRERAAWLIEHHARRMTRAVDAARENPGSTGLELIRALKWNVPMAWDDISIAQKWCILESGMIILDHQVREGLLVRTEDEQGLFRYFAAE
ncbi:MAG: MBL fold metallo-hydrolase [Slackia sp.]|nr:MBL fold metallo-hydrolase [Slackia sp.]